MRKRHVSLDPNNRPRKVGNPAHDKRNFSRTADTFDKVNVGSARPKRGGIRL